MQGSQSIGRKGTPGKIMSLKTKPRAGSVRTNLGLVSRLWTGSFLININLTLTRRKRSRQARDKKNGEIAF